MALKIEVKPNERIILGECVVTNAGPRTRLKIEGRVPILREKDIMTPGRANSPAKRIYLAVQLMYTSTALPDHHAHYFAAGARPVESRAGDTALHRPHQ